MVQADRGQREGQSRKSWTQAIKETEERGGDWDYDRWQFTQDGYRFFDLYCAEYCGKDHSKMQTVVVVHETLEDLNAWIKKYSKRAPDVDPADYGKKLYEQRGCKGCHSIDGSKRVGPSFTESVRQSAAVRVGRVVGGGRKLHPGIDDVSEGQGGRRLPAGDAQLQGTIE